jgi:hypothetical protein
MSSQRRKFQSFSFSFFVFWFDGPVKWLVAAATTTTTKGTWEARHLIIELTEGSFDITGTC